MTLILLTGAGFTYNWGGWLAREMHSKIALRVAGDLYLKETLQKHGDFKSALGFIQNEYNSSRNHGLAARSLADLQIAIIDTFSEMNSALSSMQFEFHNDITVSIGKFLAKFDAIFTLNQDLFLERHYHYPREKILTLGLPKWQLAGNPGIEDIPASNFYDDDRPLRARRRPMRPPFRTDPRTRPYFKLRGSINWFAQEGQQRLIVMGDNKHATMQRHPILTWYAQKFVEYLSIPGAKLMVIGYGFRDEHINSTLVQAWQRSQFEMFIIGPDGRDILRKVNRTHNRPLYVPESLEQITTYESIRPLRTTFGGNDPAEHGYVMRFLEGR
jgi:hypothetical protein